MSKAEKTYISPLIKRERERIKRRKKDRGAENLLKERERENKKKRVREKEKKREKDNIESRSLSQLSSPTLSK